MSAVLEYRPRSFRPSGQPLHPDPQRTRSGAPVLASAGCLQVSVAADGREVEQALRLRHRIFVQVLGGRPEPAGIDRDIFDVHCRHLIVRDTERDEVVGTYRVLMPEQAPVPACSATRIATMNSPAPIFR